MSITAILSLLMTLSVVSKIAKHSSPESHSEVLFHTIIFTSVAGSEP